MASDDVIRADVLIVGGGLAGLTAAVGLVDSGLRTVVVEREPILGGRARSWTDEVTGDPVHIGPHIFLSEYPNMLALMDILGTRDRVVWQRGKFVTIVTGQRVHEMKISPLPPPFHYIPSVLADPEAALRDKLSNARVTWFALCLSEADVLQLDDVNALAMLRGLGVTERCIEHYWSFICMAIMNIPVELCSAGALLRFFRRLNGHNRYDAGFPDGGLGDLFAPQARALIEKAGGTVMLDTGVRRFTGDDRRATGVELADGRRIEARTCVAAVPPSALRALIPRSWAEHHPPLAELVHFRPCPYICTYLWFDRKITDRQFWARTHDPNDVNCDFYDYANILTGYRGKGSFIATNCIYSHRARHLTDEEVVAVTVRELAEFLPAAAEARVVHSVVNRVPMAIHCPFPGTEQRRPPVETSIGGLLLAGDWIRTDLPSCMESACMSGWLVAESILAEQGRQVSLAKPQEPIGGLAGVVYRAKERLHIPVVPRWMGRRAPRI